MIALKKQNKYTKFYTAFGVSFGLIFPIFSIIFDLILGDYAFTIQSLAVIHTASPLHYVIDTAPFFMGLAFFFLGKKQDEVELLNLDLTKRVENATKKLNSKNEGLTKAIIQMKRSEKRIKVQSDELKLRNSELSTLKNELEIEYKKMTDSIEYAKAIQSAVLVEDQNISSFIKDSFVMYQPKDIVGGDFYMVKRLSNITILAVADCVGHGVPGALMTVLGYQMIKNIITPSLISTEAEELRPDLILYLLNEQFTAAFTNSDMKASMEIGICILHEDTYEGNYIEFAGARQSLFYFQNGEQHVLSGSKNDIGSNTSHKKDGYTTHRLYITDDINFYMFSDGYQDQFGGPNNKRFFKKNLLSLLESNHKLPMASQKEHLQENLDSWMGKNPQLDDICILGCRVGN